MDKNFEVIIEIKKKDWVILLQVTRVKPNLNVSDEILKCDLWNET